MIYNAETPLSRPRKNAEWERDCFGLQGTIYNTEAPLSRPRKNEERERDCFGLQATCITLKHFWADLAKTKNGREIASVCNQWFITLKHPWADLASEERKRSELSNGSWRQKLQLNSPIHNYSGNYFNQETRHPRQSRSFIHSYATLNCRSDYNPRCLRRRAPYRKWWWSMKWYLNRMKVQSKAIDNSEIYFVPLTNRI